MSKIDGAYMVAQAKRVVPMDKALELTGYGKFNWKMLALTALICIALVLETTGYSYILPAGQCDLQLNLELKGVVAAIPFICMMVTSHTWGYLADTRGRRICLAVALAFGSVFSILSSFAPNLIWFIVLRVISSLFISGSNAVVYAYIGEFVPQRFLDIVTSVLSSCIVASTAVMSAIAWILLPLEFRLPIEFLGIDFRPWRLMVLVSAIPSVISAALLFVTFETPKFLIGKGKSEESLEVLRSMYADNSGKSKSEFPVDIVIRNKNDVDISLNVTFMDTLRNQTFPLFKRPHLFNLLKVSVIQIGVLFNANGFFVWIPEIFNRLIQGFATGKADNMSVCNLISTTSIVNVTNKTVNSVCVDTIEVRTFPIVIGVSLVYSFYNILVAFALTKIGKRSMLLINFGFAFIIAVIINFVYNPIAGIVLFVLFNFHGTMIGVTNAFTVELFPTHLRGMAVCLALMAGRIGSVTGTNLVGQLIVSNCQLTFYVSAGVIFVSFVVSCFLPAKKI